MHWFSIPFYKGIENYLPLLAWLASPSVYGRFLFILQGKTQILFLCKVPLAPWPPTLLKRNPWLLPLNSVAIYLHILIPQPQAHDIWTHAWILSGLKIKLWFVLHYFCRRVQGNPIFVFGRSSSRNVEVQEEIGVFLHLSHLKESKQPFYVFIHF